MVLKILSGTAALIATLLAVIVVNTIRIGPPPLGEFPTAGEFAIDGKGAVERLAQAVQIRTVSRGPQAPPAQEALRGLHELLARSYPMVHATLTRETVNEYSLLYTWTGRDPSLKPILLAAHMDVVPVESGTEADWTHPPFAGAVADGFIWGRGTMDMKQSLMAILEAVEFLLENGVAPKRTVYLAFGHDEEVGGTNGAARIAQLLESRGIALDFTLDEGLVITNGIIPGVSKPAALIGLAEKGRVTLELIVEGPGGHSSMPPLSTTVGKLARAIVRLESNQMPASLQSPTAEMLRYLAPEMPVHLRAAIANWWLLGPLVMSRLESGRATNALVRTTTAVTVIRGGSKPNLVPQKASAIVDFRILPGERVEDVEAHVDEHVRSAVAECDFRILPGETVEDVEKHGRTVAADCDVAIRQTGGEPSEPSKVSDIDSASFTALRMTALQVFPDTVVAPGLLIGRTDSRRYADFADNSYRFIPMRLARSDLVRIHGTDERIAVENYTEIIRFYVQLLRNTAMASDG